MIGCGKYKSEAHIMRLATKADALILMVVGGDKGDGMTVQCKDPKFLGTIPNALRHLADLIEQDIAHQSFIAATDPEKGARQ